MIDIDPLANVDPLTFLTFRLKDVVRGFLEHHGYTQENQELALKGLAYAATTVPGFKSHEVRRFVFDQLLSTVIAEIRGYQDEHRPIPTKIPKSHKPRAKQRVLDLDGSRRRQVKEVKRRVRRNPAKR